jgi:hypothetical protein
MHLLDCQGERLVWHARKHHEKAGSPLRSLQGVGYATVGIEIRGIPPFAKNAKDGPPGDLLRSLPRTRNAPFPTPRDGYAGV